MEIKATIIAHSKSSVNGKEIITFELEYPRFIHSELMTHRLFSRNAASSRAIPVAKMIEQVRVNPAMPIHWGKNQPGMQAFEECNTPVFVEDIYHNAIWEGDSMEVARERAMVPPDVAWGYFADYIADYAKQFEISGYHKQIVNRLLEPVQMMKTVLTATEFDNFFWLRKHPDAQPEIKHLAELMWEALKISHPNILKPGDWHTPYYGDGYWQGGASVEWDRDIHCNYLKDALAISSSCCAQVSYRLLDDSLEKAHTIYMRLVESEPVHASPFEHQCTPMEECGEFWDESGDYSTNTHDPLTWEHGITHVDRDGKLWSGNLCGWIQHRQLITNNACWNFKE